MRAGKATRADTERNSSKRPTTPGCNAGRRTGASGVDQLRCCQPYRVRRQGSDPPCERAASPGRWISLASQPAASRITTSQPIQRMGCLQSLPVGGMIRGALQTWAAVPHRMEVCNLRTGRRVDAIPAAPKRSQELQLQPLGMPWCEKEDVAVLPHPAGPRVDFAPRGRCSATFWTIGPERSRLSFARGLVVS